MTNTQAIENAEAEMAATDPTSPGINPPEEPAEKTLDQLLTEAEERGYLRGRNEAIDERLSVPDLLEQPRESDEVMILENIRESVWW